MIPPPPNPSQLILEEKIFDVAKINLLFRAAVDENSHLRRANVDAMIASLRKDLRVPQRPDDN
jgi:hypothetical protein